tara:strand:+ start:550 stop:2811 length:2262 start_codon:yes stop_codon:yes gene_type:complete
LVKDAKEEILAVGREIESLNSKFGKLISTVSEFQGALVELSLSQEKANEVVGAFSDTNALLRTVVQNNTQSMNNYDRMLEGLYHNLQDNNDTSAALAANFSNVEQALIGLADAGNRSRRQQQLMNTSLVDLNDSLDRNNTTIVNLMQTMNNRLDAEKQQAEAIDKTTAAKKAADAWEKQYREGLEKTDDTTEALNIRTRIYQRALRTLADQQGKSDKNLASFNLGMQSFKAYTDAGGTSLEYFAKVLTGTEENVKILGFEAATVRKFMYGFLPPGMFRLVNKTSTALNAMGGIMRTLRPESKETANIFSRMFGSMVPSQKDVNRIKDQMAVIAAEYSVVDSEIEENRKKLEGYNKLLAAGSDARKAAIERRYGISRDDNIEEEQAILERKITVGVERRDELDTEGSELKGVLNKYQKGFRKFFSKFDIFNKRFKLIGNNSFSELLKAGTKSKYGIVRLFSRIGLVIQFFAKMLLYSVLVVAAIVGIVAFIKKNEKVFSKAFDAVVKVAQKGFELIFNGVGKYIDGMMMFINGLLEGDFQKTVDGIISMGMGALEFVGGLLVLTLGNIMAFIGGLAIETFNKFMAWAGSVPFDEYLGTLIAVALGVAAAIAFIALLPVQVPIWLGLGIALLGGLLGRMFADPISKLVKSIGDFVDKFKMPDLFADGGVSSGGLAIVGEEGPELLNLPAGARVHSNPDSKKILSSSKQETVINNNFHIKVDVKNSSDAELKKMAEKIGKMFSTSINRTLNSSLLR